MCGNAGRRLVGLDEPRWPSAQTGLNRAFSPAAGSVHWCAIVLKLELDEIDVRLLEALFIDGRASNRRLAQVVGLSESACWTRLRNLEAVGVLIGYQPRIAFDALGAFQSWADVTLVDDEPVRIAAFEALIEDDLEVAAGFIVSGRSHFRLHVITSGFERRQAVAERLLARSDLVLRVEWQAIYKACRVNGRFPRHALTLLLNRDVDD
jgi:Lrp/AsnC family transcriptional regulator, leucine-responsive regulatory protein